MSGTGNARQVLVADRLRRQQEAARERRIPRRALDTAPLSAAQERIWLLHEFNPTSPAFNRPLAVRIRGDLDIPSLRRALDTLVQRHEALRTVFPRSGGQSVQRILPPAPTELPIRDLSGEADPEAAARRLCEAGAAELFDLERGPLFRPRLFVLGPDDHVLLVLMHHIVFDGWSENILLEEVTSHYASFLGGPGSSLKEPEIQYADFASWQREELSTNRLAGQIGRCVEDLRGIPASIALPREGAVQQWSSGRVRFSIEAPLRDALQELCRQERMSLFMVLLSVFQLLLARYSGQHDIPVGSPVAGRTRVETEAVIGCFMNVLVFRARLRPEQSFRDFLQATRRVVLRALENQEAPFEKVVAALSPVRSPGRWPLFQAMFHLRNLPNRAVPDRHGLRIEPFAFESGVIAGLDLSLEIREEPCGLTGSFRFDAGLFRQETAGQMMRHFLRLLEACVADPEQSVWRACILDAGERRHLLEELNQTQSAFSPERLIHEMVRLQAKATPQGEAVALAGQHWTYARLIRHANATSRALAALGVGRGTLAGVCMERSPWVGAALLGILQAGAAYVPLDLSSPRARLDDIVADASLTLILADEAGEEVLRDSPVQIVRIDRLPAGDAEPSPDPTGVQPGDPAYVMYTSGSTGRPKGVVVPHRAVCNHLLWRREYFPLGPEARQLHRASLAFDDSVWELFEAWTQGACVVMAAPGREAETSYLVDLIRRERMTSACFIPTQLATLVKDGRLAACRTLRRLTTGAETLPASVAARVKELLPGARLFNGYGPTEATIACCYHECSGEPGLRSVPIGRPIANTEIYILDDWLQPVPERAPGEICIGGVGLAAGYLNLREETNARFVPHPFQPEGRIYRTGDLGRFLPGGEIEFAGRKDLQVKVRGHRIELAEIEGALVQHSGVREAAVTVWTPAGGETALAAYVVPEGPAPPVSELRESLQARLPRYMIPAVWAFPDALPRAPGGKVDRAALPEPQRGGAAEPAPPRTPLESLLLRTWTETLQTGRLGVRDDFFELGGHSLLAVEMLGRVEAATGVRLPLAVLFEAPTIEKLAVLIGRRAEQRSRASLVPVRTTGTRPPLFCMHANGGDVLFYRELANELGPDQPFYALRSPGLSDLASVPPALEDLARLYLDEVRSVQPAGPYHFAGFCLGAYLACEMARQAEEAGQTVGFLGILGTDGEWKLVDSTAAGLAFHMRQLAARGKLGYLRSRIRARINRILDLVAGPAVRFLERVRAPVPASWRLRVLRAIHSRLSRKYRPAPFRARITYFDSEEATGRDFRLFWEPLAQGGLDRRAVPGHGLGMLQRPAVAGLAKSMNEVLRRGQA
ncbi:MAG: amino acid adenylation domain-containing protein [Bryobacterales bacterium]|nr:amino acid adenylation domain-containing protein [Bryobacterales bacterium]